MILTEITLNGEDYWEDAKGKEAAFRFVEFKMGEQEKDGHPDPRWVTIDIYDDTHSNLIAHVDVDIEQFIKVAKVVECWHTMDFAKLSCVYED